MCPAGLDAPQKIEDGIGCRLELLLKGHWKHASKPIRPKYWKVVGDDWRNVEGMGDAMSTSMLSDFVSPARL